jgi:hypothetical protein
MNSETKSKPGLKNSGRVGGAAPSDSTAVSFRAREALRRKYRPDQVRILFIGEAPPVSGRFFYRGDSGLFRAVRATFLSAFPSLKGDEFLKEFCALGCYLLDLCGQPVDHLPRGPRIDICRHGEARLARTIRALRPRVVVTLVRAIRASVERVLAAAQWSGMHLELPYPGRWIHHRVEFERRLVPVLRKTLSQPRRKSRATSED